MEKQDLQADVIVPALQAIITGAFVSLVVGTVAGALVAWGGRSWGAGQIVAAAFTAGFIAVAVAWFNLMGDRRPALPAMPEQATVTFDQVAPPEHAIKLVVEEERSMHLGHLPVDVETLRMVARSILAGQSFAVGTQTGRGRPLTRSQFETLRGWLLKHGYISWVDANSRQLGMEWTARGKALLRGLAEREN